MSPPAPAPRRRRTVARQRIVFVAVCSAVGIALHGPPSAAQSAAELAKQAQNPLADLLSVAVQNDTSGIDDDDLTQNVFAVEPLIPIGLRDNWLLLTRANVPVVYQPRPEGGGGGGDFGLSDITLTGFVRPPPLGPVMLGIGPIIELPTAVNDRVGRGKFALGPSLAASAAPGPVVLGAIISNVFSLAGDSDTPYENVMSLEPFVNYNLDATGWYAVWAPVITADWRNRGRDVWTVPIGAGIGKVFNLGEQPLNAGLQGYYNVTRPQGVGTVTLSVLVQFLFPAGF